MEYFNLTIDSSVKKPIFPLDCKNICKTKILTRQEAENMDYLRISKFKSEKGIEYSDLIVNPIYMVSNRLKILIKEYYEDLYTLGVQLFDQNGDGKLYWILATDSYDCLSKSSKFYPDGTIKEIVLDKNKIKDKKIFKIDNILENYLIIDFNLAEKILRSGLYGVFLKKVEVV